MQVFQGLSLFVGLIVLSHGGYSAPESELVAGDKFRASIEFYGDVVRAYVLGDGNLTEYEESLLLNNTFELEKIYNEINQKFASSWKLSSIPCIYARDHNKIISGMLEKLEDMMAAKDTLYLILKGVVKKSVTMCLARYSPRDYFYDLYNLTVLTEWRGYTMLTQFNDLLNSGRAPECFDEDGNETNQDKNYTSSHEHRLVLYNNMFKFMMELMKCIPEFYACDEYHDFRKDLSSAGSQSSGQSSSSLHDSRMN